MPPAAWAQGATETETDPMQDVTINCQRQINPYQKREQEKRRTRKTKARRFGEKVGTIFNPKED